MKAAKAQWPDLAFRKPCLPKAIDQPPHGPDWVHEIKFDGYRVQALVEGSRVRLLTRTGLDWTNRFGRVVEEFAALSVGQAAIDCEAVIFNGAGVSDFVALQSALKDGSAVVQIMAFDLMWLDGQDVSILTLLDRKSKLEHLLSRRQWPHPLIRYSAHMRGDSREILNNACSMRLEGIVSKRTGASYRSGRNGDWTKSKCFLSDPFVVIGFVPSQAASGLIGSLLVGYYEDGQIAYAGRVGSGFSMIEARALADGLSGIRTRAPPLAKRLTREQRTGVVWVEPRLVAQVSYSSVTAGQVLRHATFQHFREDKPSTEIQRPAAF